MPDFVIQKTENRTMLVFSFLLQLNQITGRIDPDVPIAKNRHCCISCISAGDKVHLCGKRIQHFLLFVLRGIKAFFAKRVECACDNVFCFPFNVAVVGRRCKDLLVSQLSFIILYQFWYSSINIHRSSSLRSLYNKVGTRIIWGQISRFWPTLIRTLYIHKERHGTPYHLRDTKFRVLYLWL